MAPAGLYTFYRAVMTVSNEVKSSPPSGLQSLSPSVLRFSVLCLYSVSRRKKAKGAEEDKEGASSVTIFKAGAMGVAAGDFINTPICVILRFFYQSESEAGCGTRKRIPARWRCTKDLSRMKERPGLNIKSCA